jgi:hypothetical protein
MMAKNSFSLASSVRSIEDSLRDKASNLEKFRLRLEQVGWQENHMNFYDATYIMRSKSRFLKVDDNCPRIIDSTLIGLTDEIRARIGSVSYRIDATGLGIEEEDASFEKVLMG